MNPSRARHHGPCKHCGKRKRLLPGVPRLCRECAAAAAAWFRGERSVLDKEEVLAASPRLLLQHLLGYRDGREAPIRGGVDLASGPDHVGTVLVEVDRRRDADRLNVVAIRRARTVEATQGLRWRR